MSYSQCHLQFDEVYYIYTDEANMVKMLTVVESSWWYMGVLLFCECENFYIRKFTEYRSK